MTVYYADLPWAVECSTGLTDTVISHLPVTERGRPGHEKDAPLEYLRECGVNFLLIWDVMRLYQKKSGNEIWFDGRFAKILIYDNEIMEKLKKYPDVEFLDFPKYIDQYLTDAEKSLPRTLTDDLEYFKTYYFDHNDDPGRLDRFMEILR